MKGFFDFLNGFTSFRYLHPSSLGRIQKQCEKELIEKHTGGLNFILDPFIRNFVTPCKDRFNNEFHLLLIANKTDDLSRMFKMCQRVDKGIKIF